MISRPKNRFVFTCLLLFIGTLSAQSLPISWQWQFPPVADYTGYALSSVSLPNGHFYLYGNAGLNNQKNNHIWELDAQGRLLQDIDLLVPSRSPWGHSRMVPNTSGGYCLMEASSLLNDSATVWSYDANWNLQWRTAIPDTGSGALLGITETADGNFMLAGVEYLAGTDNGRLVKLDSAGLVVWDSTQMSQSPYQGYNVVKATSDGNVILSGYANSSDTTRVRKVSLQGNLIWQAALRTIGNTRIGDDGNGGIWALAINPDSSGHLALHKLDQSGNLQTSEAHSFGGIQLNKYFLSLLDSSGGFVAYQSWGELNTWVIRFDGNGQEVWRSHIPHQIRSVIRDFDKTTDRGCIFSGMLQTPDFSVSLPFAIRLDSLGRLVQNQLSGTAFLDANANCTRDSNEYGLPNFLVEAKPVSRFALTDSSGTYSMGLDSGQHWLYLSSPYDGLEFPCFPGDSMSVYLPNASDTIDTLDIPVQLLDTCNKMQVEMTSIGMRICALNTIHVSYMNISMDSIPNSHVIVQLDSALSLSSSSLSYTTVGQNEFRFDLGTTLPFQNGSFTMEVFLDCSTAIAQSICSSAHIFPDTGCYVPDPLWSGATVAVNGTCIPGDTVQFQIENIGSGNMLAPTSFIIVEDDILRIAGGVTLNSGGDTLIKTLGNGSTWALFATQAPFHYLNSIPRAFVEGCGVNANNTFSTGFVVNHQQDELVPFYSIDCREASNSYDPNDKTASPFGTMAEHRISESDRLEYLIRFQNVGNDTAYRVVIRDQISENLDLSSFAMASASHPYTVQFYPDRVVEWTFDSIYLVDSMTNELGSQGFVKFTLDQVPGNVPGTLIENDADIFFDFNPPIETNLSWHTVYEKFDDLIAVHLDEEMEPGNPLEVYPNPAHSEINFRFRVHAYENLEFELFDLQGRRLQVRQFQDVQDFQVERTGLPNGIYLFRITSNGEQLSTGRILLR